MYIFISLETEIIEVSIAGDFEKIKVFFNKKIGDGATGEVYEGTYEVDDNRVAVKLITKQMDLIKWKELEVLRKVDDRNIVRYFHTHTNERDDVKQIAIAMELANTDLDKWIKNGETKNIQTIKKILEDASKGLKALHTFSPVVIHRDIKPSNVLLFMGMDGKITAKLSDFGISRFVTPTKAGVTTTSPGTGTQNWMPPEALKHAESSDKFILETSFDIFPLGLLIHYTLTECRHLFSSSENDTEILINQNIFQDKPNWNYESKYCKKIEYENLVNCMTNPEPSNRPNIKAIVEHPFFWSYQRGLEFIQAVSMDLDKTNEEKSGPFRSILDNNFRKKWNKVPWDSKLCPDVKEYKESIEKKFPKKYNPNNCTELIEFISDKNRHFGTWKKQKNLTSPSTFGENGENYAEYFISRFPELIPMVFEMLQKSENAKYRSKCLLPYFVNIENHSFTCKKRSKSKA